MKQHFIDASAFIAQSRADDQYHAKALIIAKKLQKENSIGITTLRTRVGHQAAIKFYKAVQAGSNLKIIYTKQEDFEQAIKIFEKYSDKDFSFVDCVSFAIMQNYKITQAFTFDKHFEQAGFEMIK